MAVIVLVKFVEFVAALGRYARSNENFVLVSRIQKPEFRRERTESTHRLELAILASGS